MLSFLLFNSLLADSRSPSSSDSSSALKSDPLRSSNSGEIPSSSHLESSDNSGSVSVASVLSVSESLEDDSVLSFSMVSSL